MIKTKKQALRPLMLLSVCALGMSIAAEAQTKAACPASPMGSPINIEGTDPVRTNPLEAFYKLVPLKIIHQANGLEIPYDHGGFLKIGEKQRQLEKIIFKTPSEHSVLGQHYPLEMQLIHRGLNGADDAVVAIFVTAEALATNDAADNPANDPALAEITPYLPIEQGQINAPATVYFNARDLLPDNKSYYRYQGSHTTPPCQENVAWYILKTPLIASKGQLDSLLALNPRNAQPIKPRANRLILDSEQ